jgi:hypothetical protein
MKVKLNKKEFMVIQITQDMQLLNISGGAQVYQQCWIQRFASAKREEAFDFILHQDNPSQYIVIPYYKFPIS